MAGKSARTARVDTAADLLTEKPPLALVASPPAAEQPDVLEAVVDYMKDASTIVRDALRSHPELQREAITTPEIFELITAYAVAELGAQLEVAIARVRSEYASAEVYLRQRTRRQREELTESVLRMFNGRNATEVARRLQVSRATVYRVVKQSRRPSLG